MRIGESAMLNLPRSPHRLLDFLSRKGIPNYRDDLRKNLYQMSLSFLKTKLFSVQIRDLPEVKLGVLFAVPIG